MNYKINKPKCIEHKHHVIFDGEYTYNEEGIATRRVYETCLACHQIHTYIDKISMKDIIEKNYEINIDWNKD